MSNICKPGCGTGLPNFGAIDDCDIKDLVSSGEIAKVIFTKCDLAFTDIDDAAEWEEGISTSVISIPYSGNGKIDEATESGEIRIDCFTDYTISKKPFEYTSYVVDKTAQTDVDKYNLIRKKRRGLGIMFLTCDGILLINPDWTAGEVPSIKLSMLKLSQLFPGEADSQMFYKINGETLEGRAFKRVKLSDEVIEVLYANIATSGAGGL